MRLYSKIALIAILAFAFLVKPTDSEAQITEIISAVIQAIDIGVQKVQNATIDLQNVQKQIENDLSQSELGDIAGWVQQQKDIYQEYFNELWQVKTIIAYYKRVSEIITEQKQLVAQYKQAYSLVQQDKHFSQSELTYISTVYTGIINESVKNLDQILNVIQSFTVQMSDAQRLKLINNNADGIEQQIDDLQKFQNRTIQISLQRSQNQQEINSVRQLYGLQ
jgi:hypothetical protein